jgi:hypothetical protein
MAKDKRNQGPQGAGNKLILDIFRQKASRTEAAKTTIKALKTTGPRVPRKRAAASQPEPTLRRERQRRRRRRRTVRRRGR